MKFYVKDSKAFREDDDVQIAGEGTKYQPIIERDIFEEYANRTPWYILAALAFHESRFNPQAISSAGAVGLMQFMPATWEEWSDREELPTNAKAAVVVADIYLYWLHKQLKDNWELAIAAYNWGIGNMLDPDIQTPGDVLMYAGDVMVTAEAFKLWEGLR